MILRELKGVGGLVKFIQRVLKIQVDDAGYVDLRASSLDITGKRVYFFSTAITANSTTTSAPAGSFAVTSHATGRNSIFRSDGSKWQLTTGGSLTPGSAVIDAAALTSAVLTDNSGGSANTTLTALGGITTLTDSTGLSGTHDDTLAATTVPADLTGGESPTETEHNDLLAVVRVMAQNTSDVGQKIIELVADMDDAKNNFADVAAQVNALRVDLAATRTQLNALLASLRASGAITT